MNDSINQEFDEIQKSQLGPFFLPRERLNILKSDEPSRELFQRPNERGWIEKAARSLANKPLHKKSIGTAWAVVSAPDHFPTRIFL